MLTRCEKQHATRVLIYAFTYMLNQQMNQYLALVQITGCTRNQNLTRLDILWSNCNLD